MGMSGFPGGEDRESFESRCAKGLECRFSQMLRFQKVALVVHGGTIMALLHRYCVPHRDYYDWQVGNGEGWVAKVVQEGEALGERMQSLQLHAIKKL